MLSLCEYLFFRVFVGQERRIALALPDQSTCVYIYLLICSRADHLEPSSHVSLSRSLTTSCLPPFGLTGFLSCFTIPVGLAPTDRRHGAIDWTSASSNALYPTRKVRTLLLSVQSATAVEFETHSSAHEISKQAVELVWKQDCFRTPHL